MNQTEVLTKLKKLIVTEMEVNLSEAEFETSTPLFEQALGVDSIAIVELISLTEEHFEIRYTDDDLVANSFANLNALSKLITAKIADEKSVS